MYKESPMGTDGCLGISEMSKMEQTGIADGGAGNNR